MCPNNDDEYQCAICKGIFSRTKSVADATVEMKENFGDDFESEDCDEVCDDCYQEFMEWYVN